MHDLDLCLSNSYVAKEIMHALVLFPILGGGGGGVNCLYLLSPVTSFLDIVIGIRRSI